MTFSRTFLTAWALAATLACVAAGPAAQAASSVWGGLHPVPDAHSLEDVRWNPDRGEYIAVGEGGAILTSADRSTWTVQNTPTVQKLYGVTWDGTRYVVCGEGGLVLSSTDGINWIAHDTNQRNALFDIAWNGSVYVVVGQEGALHTSPDLQDWTEQDSDTGASLQGVTWNANVGLFVAVGSTRTIITSPDGVEWTLRERGNFVNQDNTLLEEVATDGLSTFVAVGRGGKILTSGDGVTWDDNVTSGTEQGLQGVTWIGDRFVAVGIGDAGDPDDPADDVPSVVLISVDGASWTPASNTGTTDVLRAVDGTGAALAAVGEGVITTSDNSGDTWDELLPTATNTLNDITWDGSWYVAVGDTGRILTSSDGNNWAANAPTISNLNGIAWEAGPQYVAVGDDATILTSSDRTNWSAATGVPAALTTEALHDVIFKGGQYVAVGDAGTVLTSPDGDNWSLLSAVTSNNLNAIAYKNGQFVAVGDEGTILTGATPSSLTQANFDSNLTDDLHDVAFVHDGGILAVGEGGTVLEAVTAGGWARRNAGSGNTWRGVVSNSLQVMLVGDAGNVRRSETGLRWTSLFSDTGKDLRAVLWDNERFLAAGEDGTILTSGAADVSVEVDPPDSATVNNAKDDGTGTVFVYTVTNIANIDVPQVQFQTPIPSEFDFVDVNQPPQLSAGVCGPNATGLNVICNLGTLDGGSSGLRVTVVLNPLAQGTFQLTGSVSAAGDVNTANDDIDATITVGEEVFNIQDPDVDFDPDSGFGAVDLRMLALLAVSVLIRAAGVRRRQARAAPQRPPRSATRLARAP